MYLSYRVLRMISSFFSRFRSLGAPVVLILIVVIVLATTVMLSWILTRPDMAVVAQKYPSHGPLTLTQDYEVEHKQAFLSSLPMFLTLAASIITVLVNVFIFIMQFLLTQDVERLKRIAEKSIPAFGDLYAGATNYYRALAPLQTGDFDLIEIEKAEDKMKIVEGNALFVTAEYRQEWMKFWQSARYHKEHANKNVQKADRSTYWGTAAKDLGKHIRELQRIADRHFRS
jgi:hypothetical protein